MGDVPAPESVARRRLAAIGARWPMLVLLALRAEPTRFGELQRAVGGISQKMLTQTLRTLEGEALVTRTVHAEVPPRVEYALTPDGAEARAAVAQLAAWSAREPR